MTVAASGCAAGPSAAPGGEDDGAWTSETTGELPGLGEMPSGTAPSEAGATGAGRGDSGATGAAGSGSGAAGEGSSGSSGMVSTLPAPALPPTKDVTISLEGSDEKMTFRLFLAPPDWPLGFHTYYPDDWIAEPDQKDSAVRFVTNYGGRRNDDAYLLVRLFPKGTKEADAREAARSIAEKLGLSESSDEGEGWAIVEYESRGSADTYADVRLGEEAGVYFCVVERYPAEFGDGFGPRAHELLDVEWRWSGSDKAIGGS